MYRPSSLSELTMLKETVRRSLPDSHETVSGIAGAVHALVQEASRSSNNR